MSTGSSADAPTPPETINTQTARKIRSKLYLPCDVSDGTHVWAERCTATSHSPSLTSNFVRFSVMRTGSGYSISDREQRHAKCCRLSMVAYLMSGECHMFDLRWIATSAFTLAFIFALAGLSL